MNKFKKVLKSIKINPNGLISLERFSFSCLKNKDITAEQIFKYNYNDSMMFKDVIDKLLMLYGLENKNINQLTYSSYKKSYGYKNNNVEFLYLNIKELDDLKIPISIDNTIPIYTIIGEFYSIIDKKLYNGTKISTFDVIPHYNEINFYINLINNSYDIFDLPYLSIHLLTCLNKYGLLKMFVNGDSLINKISSDMEINSIVENIYMHSYLTNKDLYEKIYDNYKNDNNYLSSIIDKTNFIMDNEIRNLKKFYGIDIKGI